MYWVSCNGKDDEVMTDVPEIIPAAAAAAAAAAPGAAPPTLDARFEELNGRLQTLFASLKEVLSTVRVLQKDVSKQMRMRNGRRLKTSVGGGVGGGGNSGGVGGVGSSGNGGEGTSEEEAAAVKTRSPSGFAKPTRLSALLCDFLNLPPGSMMARTMVTKLLNKYIKDNDLQNKEDKRRIVPNEKLRSILNLSENDTITYFNLQSHIKHHFERE
jgi:hypothetical protein